MRASKSSLSAANDVLRLKAGQTLDFEATPTVPVTITATDVGGLSRQVLFNLDVVDVNESTNDPDLQAVSMELGSTEFPLDLNPAIDPEGDTLAYTVTELPAAGTVLLNGGALASGEHIDARPSASARLQRPAG